MDFVRRVSNNDDLKYHAGSIVPGKDRFHSPIRALGSWRGNKRTGM